jgi:hypothetical protein
LPDLSQWSHVRKSSTSSTRPHATSSASFHERQQQYQQRNPPPTDTLRQMSSPVTQHLHHQQQYYQDAPQLNNYASNSSEALAHEGDFLIDPTPTNMSTHRLESMHSHDSVYTEDDDEGTHSNSHHSGAHRPSDDYSDSTMTANSSIAIPTAAYERVRVPHNLRRNTDRRGSKDDDYKNSSFTSRARDTCCGLSPLLRSATVRYASVCINILLCALIWYSYHGGKHWMCHRRFIVNPQTTKHSTAIAQNSQQISITGANDEQFSIKNDVLPQSNDKFSEMPLQPSDETKSSQPKLDKPAERPSIITSSESTPLEALSKLDTVTFDLASHNHVWQYCDNWKDTPKSILPNAICSREPQTEQGLF